jgi:predicted ATPase
VLDNFEHLLAYADLCIDILATAPQTKLLLTSREKLNIREEWALEVAGLEVPIGEPANPAGYSAVTLFIQQAQRMQPDFVLTPANQADVIRLCRLVDGMPLGLELAATWLPVLSCAEIAAEIERDLDFLTSSIRNVPDRHRSMRAVFESSWNLLPEAERNALKQLSVFVGGFQREAAQVASAPLPLLLELYNKSLLRRTPSGRYDMHELIRQYAAEKLAQSPSEQAEILDRHCAYYAEFMQQCEKWLRSPKQTETIREIEAELGNIQIAWQRAVESEQATKDRAKDLLARLEIIYPSATIELALERVGAQALEAVVARVLEAISIEAQAAE